MAGSSMHGHEAWLKKALSDLKSSKKLIQGDDETLDTAAYHTQQCAEKAFKAYLEFKKQSTPKTHDLERLLEMCIVFDIVFKTLLEDASNLSIYAIYARYPDDRFYIDRQEIQEAIKKAAKIYRFVLKKIEVPINSTLHLFEE